MMVDRQSWEKCKYSISNLDHLSVPKIKLLNAIFGEKEWEKLLRENKIPQDYYCKNTKITKLGVYFVDGFSISDNKSIKVAKLFHLDLSNNYEGSTNLDLFGEERVCLEREILRGLCMCAHCKFYEEKD